MGDKRDTCWTEGLAFAKAQGQEPTCWARGVRGAEAESAGHGEEFGTYF